MTSTVQVSKSNKEFQLNEQTVVRSKNERRKWLAGKVALFQVSTPATRVAAVIQLQLQFCLNKPAYISTRPCCWHVYNNLQKQNIT